MKTMENDDIIQYTEMNGNEAKELPKSPIYLNLTIRKTHPKHLMDHNNTDKYVY